MCSTEKPEKRGAKGKVAEAAATPVATGSGGVAAPESASAELLKGLLGEIKQLRRAVAAGVGELEGIRRAADGMRKTAAGQLDATRLLNEYLGKVLDIKSGESESESTDSDKESVAGELVALAEEERERTTEGTEETGPEEEGAVGRAGPSN